MMRLFIGLCLALAASATVGVAQDVSEDEIIGGPLAGPMPFVNAPFSADAVTTVRQTLRDGTPFEQRTTARYYRDSAGRVRVELLMEGLGAPKTMSERHMRLMIHPMTVIDALAPWRVPYTVDPVTRTVRLAGRGIVPLSNGGGVFLDVPVGGVKFLHFARAQEILKYHPELAADSVRRESLGPRRIEGIETTGHRTTVTIPPSWLYRYAEPIELVDEEWQSSELLLLIYARYSDSRGGVIEYRSTNIRRTNPPSDLFVVPANYRLDEPAGHDDPLLESQDGRWPLKPWRRPQSSIASGATGQRAR
jgi:hypothetical protein